METNWTYTVRCRKCEGDISYVSLSKKEYAWKDFYKLMNMTYESTRSMIGFCDSCEMFTVMDLISFDADERDG